VENITVYNLDCVAAEIPDKTSTQINISNKSCGTNDIGRFHPLIAHKGP
jgi:hypothetical protein